MEGLLLNGNNCRVYNDLSCIVDDNLILDENDFNESTFTIVESVSSSGSGFGMLKVIGASWVQTRISWTLLGSISLLGLIAVFFGSSYRTEADGKYAATVFYGKESKFRLEYWGQNNDPQDIRRGVARGYYQPDISKTGWASLEIETQESYPDTIQACAAGMLEGALSWQHIQHHWRNTVQKTCVGRQDFCRIMRIFLQENSEHIKKLAAKFDPIDPFWHQVNLFYIQLEGIETGWRSGIRRSRRDYDDIPTIDFLWMNIMPDLRDLERKFNGTLDLNPDRPSLAFAVLKYFPEDPTNYLLAHSSAGTYNSMLRIQKRYAFGYHSTGDFDSDLVNGRIQMFTSYPGAIFSGDDYYQIENNSGEILTIVGTELKNYNQSSWSYLDYEYQVLMGPRVMAANRLSRDGDDWSAIFTRRNSGTGNKHWLIIDTADNFTVWAVEQMPGLTHAQEVTQHIIDKKYWIACGIPYFQDILMQSTGNDEMSSLYHLKDTNPLYVALHKYVDTINNKDSIINLVRSYEISAIGRTDLNGISNLYDFLNLTHNMNKHHKISEEIILENEIAKTTNKGENIHINNTFEKEAQQDDNAKEENISNKNITSKPEETQENVKENFKVNIANNDEFSRTNLSRESQKNDNIKQESRTIPNTDEYIRTNFHEESQEKSNEMDKTNILKNIESKTDNDTNNEYNKEIEKNHKYSGIHKEYNRKIDKFDNDKETMTTNSNKSKSFNTNNNYDEKINSSVEQINKLIQIKTEQIKNNTKLNESIIQSQTEQNSTKLNEDKLIVSNNDYNLLIQPKIIYYNAIDTHKKTINKHNEINTNENKKRLDEKYNKNRNNSNSIRLANEFIRQIDEPIGKTVKNNSDFSTRNKNFHDLSKIIKIDEMNNSSSNTYIHSKVSLRSIDKLNEDSNSIRHTREEKVEKNLINNVDHILIDTSITNEMSNIRNFKYNKNQMDSENNHVNNLGRDAHSFKNLNKQYRGIIDIKINQGNEYFVSISGPPYYKRYNSSNKNLNKTGNHLNATNTNTKSEQNIKEDTTKIKEQAQSLLSNSSQPQKHGNIEPFQWSKSKINFVQHIGHPDLWDFQLFKSNWVWK